MQAKIRFDVKLFLSYFESVREGKFLTTKEAADELDLTLRAVQKMIESGRLKAERAGRDYLIPVESLENIERKSKAGRPPKTKKAPSSEENET